MSKSSIVADIGADALVSRLETHWQSYTNEPTTVEINGKTFTGLPSVYSPAAPLTKCVANSVSPPPGARGLDMGCGSGVLGIFALERGASSMVFADINPAALANARENITRHGVADRATVVESDLFSALGDERFDYIVFNSPFLYSKTDLVEALGAESNLFRPGVPPPSSFFDVGYKLLNRFFSQVRDHLAPDGVLQMAFSNIGNSEELARLLEEYKFTIESTHTEVTGMIEWRSLRLIPV
ncbi:MAG: methyltransferase [Kofleriaceae bacterium]|nr:methyltransferase [Kofleriaceae bacterium]